MEYYTHSNGKTQGYRNNSYLHMDRLVNAAWGRYTHGISPAAINYAFSDWMLHILKSPGKQLELIEEAWKLQSELTLYTLRSLFGDDEKNCIEPQSHDSRFKEDEWKQWPYNYLHQAFLLSERWWHDATTDIRAVTKHHSDVVSFVMRQYLDFLSPSNYLLTNPVVWKTTVATGGINLAYGAKNFAEDFERYLKKEPPIGSDRFVVGKNVACTPGKVIFRNYIIELIQYTPTTETVHPEPILIIPAWIMKYYILDLSQTNSLVKYLVDSGYTVFMISWRNFTSADRDIRMLDYREKGAMEAIRTIQKVCPDQKIHAMGYCLGGTLLSIVAAHAARENMGLFKTITLLASQTDFEEAGELTLFIDESQVTYLEDLMWDQGVLDSKQMAGAFQLLRTKDLIYSRVIREYLLGKRSEMIDLMAWNADATRLPFKMHSQYLRELFLNNDLAEGRYPVEDKPVTLGDIREEIFCVATTKDHVSPWRSVFKLHLLANTDITFLLTSGGHNAGIISEPGHSHRTYQVRTQTKDEIYTDPDLWQSEVAHKKGSWWPEFVTWLNQRSSQKSKPPHMGIPDKAIIMDAPGQYVLEK